LRFRGSAFFLLEHPECIDPWFARNPFACLLNSDSAFCPGAVPRSFYPSLSVVRRTSSRRDDLSGRPHAPSPSRARQTSSSASPSGARQTTSSASPSVSHSPSYGRQISNILPATAPDLRASSRSASPPDSAFPICPVCDIASAQSCFDCEQQFCANHIYSCADCGNQYCGACLDAHHADGHWTDSDTAFELASTRRIVRSSSANLFDLPPSGSADGSISLSPNLIDLRPSSPVRESISLESAACYQRHQSSRSSIRDLLKPLLSFLFQRVTRVAKGRMFQSVSLLFQRLTRPATPPSPIVHNAALPLEARS
jgi:hypothetical protein